MQTDLSAVKTKQQAAWASGDYAVIGTTLQIVGETLCEALDLRAGQRVLDAAAELARVCKSGGKIGLANWTPTSFVGEMFKVMGRYIPPVAGVKPPSLWGNEDRLRELFGSRIAALQAPKRHFVFRYRSSKHWLDTFRTYY